MAEGTLAGQVRASLRSWQTRAVGTSLVITAGHRGSCCGVCSVKNKRCFGGEATYYRNNRLRITCFSMHLECMQLHLIFNATNAGLHLTSFNRDAHLNTPLLASAAKRQKQISVASPSAFRFPCKVSRAAVQCLLSGRSAPHTSSGGGTKSKPRTRLIRTGFEWIAAAFCCLFCVCARSR